MTDLESSINWPRFPYPGLRPFGITATSDESLIFRGRDRHRDDVIERLDLSQLVSVVGPSGCGKSSLVKVGVIPALEAGVLTRAGYRWQAIRMRPGQDPIGNLATAFAELHGPDGNANSRKQDLLELLSGRRSGLWLAMEELGDILGSDTSAPRRVLLLLDQFEEIFSSGLDPEEVNQFIRLIDQFFRNPHIQLFIVLTMRTDFIGQCANFPGLAEILNKTQYVTPVLRGKNLRDAIEQPALAYGGQVDDDLVKAIVRDMGDGVSYDADHLPLMQHALLWLWYEAWRDSGLGEPPSPTDARETKLRLTLKAYEDSGGLQGILNRHADDLLGQATANDTVAEAANAAQTLFRRLSERDTSGRYKRAPAHEREICEIAGCSLELLRSVEKPFVDHSFVEVRTSRSGDALLDLSHESLIRQWKKLREWADIEADKLITFRKVVSDADSWVDNGRSSEYLKTGGQLRVLEEWWRVNRPTEPWASRYSRSEEEFRPLSTAIPRVDDFKEASTRDRRKRRVLRLGLVAVVVVAIAAALPLYYRAQLEAANETSEKVRTESVSLFAEEKLREYRPDKALQVTLAALEKRPNGQGAGSLAALATKALQNLYEERVFRLDVNRGHPVSVSYGADGRWLVASMSNWRHPYLWDLKEAKGAELQALRPVLHWRSVWHARAGVLLLSSRSGQVRLVPLVDVEGQPSPHWDKQRVLEDQRDASVGIGMFSGDGRRIVTGGPSAHFRMWDTESGSLLAAGEHGNRVARQGAFAVNVDGSLIAAAVLRDQIEILDVNGSTIVGGSIPIPENMAGQGCEEAQGLARAMVFHPTSRSILAFTVGCRVIVVDVKQSSRPIFYELRGHSSDVTSLAFSRDGSQIVTGTEDGVVRLFEIPSVPERGVRTRGGIPVEAKAVLGRHEGELRDLEFSPDDKTLASAGRDRTIRMWRLKPALVAGAQPSISDVIKLAKQHLPAGIGQLDKLALCLSDEVKCLE